MDEKKKALFKKVLEEDKGVIPFKPEYVGRVYCGANRIGNIQNSSFDFADQDGLVISERWYASEKAAENPRKNKKAYALEGLSKIPLGKGFITFQDALKEFPNLLLSSEHIKKHGNIFGVLSKALDPAKGIPLHFHWDKEETYYFPDIEPKGDKDYVSYGVEGSTTKDEFLKAFEAAISKENGMDTYALCNVYKINTGTSLHIKPGIYHSSASLFAIELQTLHDGYAHLSGEVDKINIFRDKFKTPREVLDAIDFKINLEPNLFEKGHIIPEMKQGDGFEEGWVFPEEQTDKYSGKKVIIRPGKNYKSKENRHHLLIVLKGRGSLNVGKSIDLEAWKEGKDEFFVTNAAAIKQHSFTNTSNTDLEIYKIFGPRV